MGKYYSVNQLCRLTKVSVRTLHYYDEIHLLKPSHRTAKGHRLYSQMDILKLQQIVTFRFLGFTLSKIKTLLSDKHENIVQLLKLQAEAIAEEAARIEKVTKFFQFLVKKYDREQMIDWEANVKIIEVLQQKITNTHDWYQKYLSSAEEIHFKQFVKTRTDKWLALFAEVRENLDTDPCSAVGAALVNKWVALADQAYGTNPALRNKLWQAYQAGLIPHEFFPYDKDVIAYLGVAFERHCVGEGRPCRIDA